VAAGQTQLEGLRVDEKLYLIKLGGLIKKGFSGKTGASLCKQLSFLPKGRYND